MSALWELDRKQNKMAIGKRARPEEGFYRNLDRDVRLKAEKTRPNIPEKVDQEKFYVIEVSARHFYENRV